MYKRKVKWVLKEALLAFLIFFPILGYWGFFTFIYKNNNEQNENNKQIQNTKEIQQQHKG